MTTRLNITIPDELSERLDRVRDRINASKVCAQALEREIDMIEMKPAAADPEVQRAIQRLQTTADKWRGRGAKDGRSWALETATREELISVSAKQGDDGFEYPSSFDQSARIRDWVSADVNEEGMFLWFDEENPEDPGAADTRAQEESRLRTRVEASVDGKAFTRGWLSAARDVWDMIKPALTV